ncbi:hypothetical protein [Pseudonocardia sp. WMMC193]|uniref:hypothetical protein n=1 Tax=Pseudonocardia sp. WMMC193 TaxID=2911965 RepID=UPI001F1BD393|nr:hypothetical protein [Pseudonocardia sp. WMMC193]MCF7548164.1 hypothetical protein [Pseudonocardia sp. WMMC193]
MSDHKRAELTGNEDLDSVIKRYDLSEREVDTLLAGRPKTRLALEGMAEGVSRARREVYNPTVCVPQEELLPPWLTVKR